MAEETTNERYGPAPRQRGTLEETFPYREPSWTELELHHLIADVSGLKEAVGTLKESVKDQTSAISGVRRTMHIAAGIVIGAGAVVGLLLGLIAWLVDKGFDRLLEVLATK